METSRVAQMLLSPTQARTQRAGPTFFLSARLGKALCALEQQQRTGHTLGSSGVCMTLKSFPIQKQPLISGGKKSPAKKLYSAFFPQLKYTQPLLLLTWLPCPFKETQTLSLARSVRQVFSYRRTCQRRAFIFLLRKNSIPHRV